MERGIEEAFRSIVFIVCFPAGRCVIPEKCKRLNPCKAQVVSRYASGTGLVLCAPLMKNPRGRSSNLLRIIWLPPLLILFEFGCHVCC